MCGKKYIPNCMFPPRHFQEPHLLWRAATRHFVPATKATWKPQMTSEAPTTYACRHDIVKPSRRVRSADSPTPTSDCTQIMYTFMRTKSGSVRQFSFSQWKTFSMWNVPTWLRHVMSCHVMSCHGASRRQRTYEICCLRSSMKTRVKGAIWRRHSWKY